MDIATILAKLWNNTLQATANSEPLSIAVTCVCLCLLLLLLLKTRSSTSQKKSNLSNPSTVNTQEKNIQPTSQTSLRDRLKTGLGKTRTSLSGGLATLFTTSTKLDEDLLEEVHEKLYRADLGVETATKLVDSLRADLKKAERTESFSWDDAKKSLKRNIFSMLDAIKAPIKQPQSGPQVILVVGVNGVGKTTSVGKLASHFMNQNKSVLLCAADTYRAAAIDQLMVWGERIGCDVIKHSAGADPASVAYDAVKAAKSREIDVLLIDTAGRLHNKTELMDELAKVKRVIGKDLPEAPHETWIVVDATTGQNAFQQISAFGEATPLTGMIVTKLDGTAKGGVIIGASDKFKVPVRYIGVGEKAEDLQEFIAEDFVELIF